MLGQQGGLLSKGDIMDEINELLKEVEQDEYACYTDEWESRAVGVINDYYYERDNYDDIVYDLASEEWADLVKQQLDSRGWQGLLFFLGKLEPMDNYACLDGYGNAVAVNGKELVGYLKDIKQELENERE